MKKKNNIRNNIKKAQGRNSKVDRRNRISVNRIMKQEEDYWVKL